MNLDDLINCRTVEATRIEFKAVWDEYTRRTVIQSVCAFANDLLNLNGGYIVLGVAEENGHPILPPRGLDDDDVDRIQREIIGMCKGSITPEYLPVLFVETFQEKTILVVMAPAGDNRPYQAPKRQGEGKSYWVRSGSLSIEAEADLLRP